jgi:thiamine pyrophosphokinase
LITAAIRVAVDGGANYLPRDHKFKPDIIAGDLDSIEKESLEFFQKIGTRIIHTPDQDQTDFTKAVQKVIDEKDSSIEYVIAFSSIGGRPDHVLSNFHTLFLFIKMIPVIILDNGVSISFALDAVSDCQMDLLKS